MTVRVAGARPGRRRKLGRRSSAYIFDRVFVPSAVVDLTELTLRQAGIRGLEGFCVWAGDLLGGSAHVTSVAVPPAVTAPTHGEIAPEATASVLEALDQRDLVPICQIHSHPGAAFLSDVDAIQPLVALPGFLSIVVPRFGFVDVSDVSLWSVHEYRGPGQWLELTSRVRAQRLIVDDSFIQVM